MPGYSHERRAGRKAGQGAGDRRHAQMQARPREADPAGGAVSKLPSPRPGVTPACSPSRIPESSGLHTAGHTPCCWRGFCFTENVSWV